MSINFNNRTVNVSRMLILVAAFFLLAGESVVAQVSPSLFDYVRSDLKWRTIDTDHFMIHYHVDKESDPVTRTALTVAKIAEDVFEPITDLYKYVPNTKVSIVLKDFEDYSNGAAYFFDNKIEIWLPSLDSPLRGDHNWLRNVITHEYTHIVQVQKTMKKSRRTPIGYFQWLDYEDVRRPDVLYGYPNKIVSYPVPVLNNPAWLAEGTAQYQRMGLHYDNWDSHRDMLLRTRIMNGEELSLNEMATFFSKTSLERESIYNHGFAFSIYLANEFGEDVLRKISEELSKWRNWNVEKAITAATGIDAKQVHKNWIESLRNGYQSSLAEITDALIAGETLESVGFNNHFPKYSPDGSKIAYLSNKGEDYNLVSLYIVDQDQKETNLSLGRISAGGEAFCSLGAKIKSGMGSGFDWYPDGKSIVYAKLSDDANGKRISDLHRLDLDTKKTTRLTVGARAMMPTVSPDGKSIVYVSHGDGTTNISVYNLETEERSQLSEFRSGEQVFNPKFSPDGKVVYFAHSRLAKRDIYRIDIDGKKLESVLTSAHDERNPILSKDGTSLIYSSDKNGIYNLYTYSLETGANEQLTQVIGGAFEPSSDADGNVLFTRFEVSGYKVAKLNSNSTGSPNADYVYDQPESVKKLPVTEPYSILNDADDVLLAENLDLADRGEDYKDTFTSFQFYPVVRLDQYANGQSNRLPGELRRSYQGGQFLRNTKVGFYMGSREILEGLSFFGGLLVGPTSRNWDSLGDFFAPGRVVKLERDAFLQIDFKRGLPFFKKRWSPQLSVELFNIRRNVENGLEIEEFPCTACFPGSTFADIAFSLWEVNLFSRSKINPATLLEFGFRYSPYRARTEAFFSEEYDQSIGASSTKYFIGRGASIKLYHEAIHPRNNTDVIPEGLKLTLGYDYEPGRLLDRFDVDPDQGILLPKYSQYNNHKLFADIKYAQQLPGAPMGGVHGVGLKLSASTILGEEVDDFFNDYVGGLVGARGYPFYALGGNETVWLQASYQFPIVAKFGKQFMFLNFDKLYGRVYADAAQAWSGAWPGFGQFKKDIGGELRLGMGSFYLFPTALFFSGTYGFDEFDFGLDDGFVTVDNESFVTYGKDLQFHFGILFGFDL